MKRLSEREETIMIIVWNNEPITVKNLKERIPIQLHINTIATLMKILSKKGFLKYEKIGSYLFFSASISKEDYTLDVIEPLLSSLFGNSLMNALIFLLRQGKITHQELKDKIFNIKDDLAL